jgi:hypothetical protein
MWHPLRLARDFACADATGDRTIFGVGRGYHARVETRRSMLDQNANRRLFRSRSRSSQAFDNEALSHQGKHYTLPPEVPYRGYTVRTSRWCRDRSSPVETWQPVVSASPRGLIHGEARHQGAVGGGAWRWNGADHGLSRRRGAARKFEAARI